MASDTLRDVLIGLRVAERSITGLLEEIAAAREDASEQREMIIRLQEQLSTTRDNLRALERVVQGDGQIHGLSHQLAELRRAEASLRTAVQSLSNAADQTQTAAVQKHGHNVQAIATVITAIIGAVAGVVSLLINMRH